MALPVDGAAAGFVSPLRIDVLRDVTKQGVDRGAGFTGRNAGEVGNRGERGVTRRGRVQKALPVRLRL